MRAISEDDVRTLEAAPPLDVHVAWAVHEDVGDRPILHQRLDRSQPKRLGRDLDDESIAVLATERCGLRLEHALDHAMDLRLNSVGRNEIELGQIESLDELPVDPRLELGEADLGPRRR